ncbi:MAG: DMT family protein [Bryobacteraceae bacterium]|nr:DMT family protein [Bryobacteraceae bacterium]
MWTVLLLIGSNIFMTLAWYGHLKHRSTLLWKVIAVSWLIALPEYCLQVPANRLGYGKFTAYQLKILQEVITLAVFAAFAWWYFGERIRWNHAAAFVCLVGAVVFTFWGRR